MLPLNVARPSFGRGSRIQQHLPLVLHHPRFAPSASAPSSLGDVSLGDVMAQLQCMDACLDTLSTELYQVNVHVGRIARRQASMGGFALEATPSPPPPVAFDSDVEDDGDDNDASDDDGDASSTD